MSELKIDRKHKKNIYLIFAFCLSLSLLNIGISENSSVDIQGYRYIPLDIEDLNAFTLYCYASSSGSMVLNLIDGNYEDKSASITIVSTDWSITLPNNSKAVHLRLTARSTAYHINNQIYVKCNSMSYWQQSLEIKPYVANLVCNIYGTISIDENGKIFLQIYHGSGTIEVFIAMMGYYI